MALWEGLGVRMAIAKDNREKSEVRGRKDYQLECIGGLLYSLDKDDLEVLVHTVLVDPVRVQPANVSLALISCFMQAPLSVPLILDAYPLNDDKLRVLLPISSACSQSSLKSR
jgi:hypothetical protein